MSSKRYFYNEDIEQDSRLGTRTDTTTAPNRPPLRSIPSAFDASQKENGRKVRHKALSEYIEPRTSLTAPIRTSRTKTIRTGSPHVIQTTTTFSAAAAAVTKTSIDDDSAKRTSGLWASPPAPIRRHDNGVLEVARPGEESVRLHYHHDRINDTNRC
mmetsp:Transcript_25175/g.36838  ORF Transcript_25175/g.36838 Transcript_25175/m.36838 type:complete len:157 (-) Transcript_25175:1156-1626(-)